MLPRTWADSSIGESTCLTSRRFAVRVRVRPPFVCTVNPTSSTTCSQPCMLYIHRCYANIADICQRWNSSPGMWGTVRPSIVGRDCGKWSRHQHGMLRVECNRSNGEIAASPNRRVPRNDGPASVVGLIPAGCTLSVVFPFFVLTSRPGRLAVPPLDVSRGLS